MARSLVLRLIGLALFLALAGLIWLGFEQIGLLSSSFLWPYRYLILAVAAFLLLTGVERLVTLLPKKQQD